MSHTIQNIVILTGAGISAESGIQTFRASDGLWHEHHIEDVATPEGFAANPQLVQTFYNDRRRQLKDAAIQPNPAHLALARLESEWPGELLLVTQNVDNLHERAGSNHLIHMHGQLDQIRCSDSGTVFHWEDDIKSDQACRCCNKTGTLRPNIVWFGEMPFLMDTINDALINCDLFISIGTSGKVYPAAGYVEAAKQMGAQTVELNLDPTDSSPVFDLSVQGKAGEMLPEFVEKLLTTGSI
ncbi:MAG: Sir2 family NAD+-dependent deacetylase [Leucothrix sp.]